MLKVCKWCGKVHSKKEKCNKQPNNQKEYKQEVSFRSSYAWQNKREEIRRRDNYLCQICLRKMLDTDRQFNSNDLEVHHIEKARLRPDLKLENKNLITLCTSHHKMADEGKIEKSLLLNIVKEQEQKENDIPPSI